jgi:CCR4-NOT transcription complex subunit 7/8
MLKIIQLGLSFTDDEGNLPNDGRCTWQFNFKFNLKYASSLSFIIYIELIVIISIIIRYIRKDLYAQDSIELLAESGIDFEKHENQGVDVHTFGEMLMSSGIVLSDEVKWISFHSAYDFGYLMKLLTNNDLPEEESEFFELLHTYFPCIYDIKYLMKSCDALKGGLQQLAGDLGVQRIGPAHQAGSDSLLTSATFFKMMQVYFENNLNDNKYIGVLYGLGQGYDNASNISHGGMAPQLTSGASNTGLLMGKYSATDITNMNGNHLNSTTDRATYYYPPQL